uniref:Uncharacterized protein n=1 Tax=Oryza glumipatula TaxID=40148 RepID=A0A0E0BJ63_9ORYZ
MHAHGRCMPASFSLRYRLSGPIFGHRGTPLGRRRGLRPRPHQRGDALPFSHVAADTDASLLPHRRPRCHHRHRRSAALLLSRLPTGRPTFRGREE